MKRWVRNASLVVLVILVFPIGTVPLGFVIVAKFFEYPAMVVRAHTTMAYEMLSQAAAALEHSRAAHASYPAQWPQDLYLEAEPGLGPPELNHDIQLQRTA